jgi:hypothetical protein
MRPTKPLIVTRRALTVIFLATVLGGCVFVQNRDSSNDGGGGAGGATPPDDVIEAVGIDANGLLTAEPGAGAGLFVEYLDEGQWHVWTTCDTDSNGAACSFDVDLVGANLGLVQGEDLEGSDRVELESDYARALFETTSDTDGVRFRLDEGAPLRLGVWLDGVEAREVVFWVEDGAIVQGIPTTPTDFVPGGP